jgi:hypothetical protein
VILSDLFICMTGLCGLRYFRSRNSPKAGFGPPTCACGCAMGGIGHLLL